MLTETQMNENREEFISIISEVQREGANIEKLVKKLDMSDFFTAPASTKYHASYEGGLCEHSLNVYHNLKKLVESTPNLDESCYDTNSIAIVGLLHDISKMNIYEKTFSNKKIYCADGDKQDASGSFKWVSEPSWKIKDNKFVYGNHEATSEFIARQFIPLTIDESVAILHHMGGMNWDSAKDNMSDIYNNYSLALLLHISDMMSTFISERCD